MNNKLYNPMQEAAQYSTKMMRAAASWLDVKNREVEIATLDKSEVLRMGHVSLYRYTPLAKKQHDSPLFIIYSQIGRYTMMDLQPDRSLIRNLLEQGFEVYLIDWGHPGRADRWMTFEDYVEDLIAKSVDFICAQQSVKQISILGVCEGGVFSTCYAALHPEKVQHLALAVTPIDFHASDEDAEQVEYGTINRWVQSLSDEAIEALEHLPGELTGAAFLALTPVKTLTKYNLDAVDALAGEREQVLNYFRMEKWLSDRPNHPGAAARTWLRDLYKENLLVKGEFKLDDEIVNLQSLDMPILNVFASKDHIVPPATSRALQKYVDPHNYTELELDVGHIGTFVSQKANRALSEALTAFFST